MRRAIGAKTRAANGDPGDRGRLSASDGPAARRRGFPGLTLLFYPDKTHESVFCRWIGVMLEVAEPGFTAFAAARRIDSGPLLAVAASVKRAIDAGETGEILIFEDCNARTVEIDFRGSLQDVQASARRALADRQGRSAAVEEEPRRGSGASQARRRRPGSHFAATALDLAVSPAWRRLGGPAPSSRGSLQGSGRPRAAAPRAGGDVSRHVGVGRRPRRL